MKVLLDNNFAKGFGELVNGHEIVYSQDIGWGNLRNGALLKAAEEGGYQAVITGDKQMQFQQNLTGRRLGVLILNSHRITLKDISPLADQVNAVLETMQFARFYLITPLM